MLNYSKSMKMIALVLCFFLIFSMLPYNVKETHAEPVSISISLVVVAGVAAYGVYKALKAYLKDHPWGTPFDPPALCADLCYEIPAAWANFLIKVYTAAGYVQAKWAGEVIDFADESGIIAQIEPAIKDFLEEHFCPYLDLKRYDYSNFWAWGSIWAEFNEIKDDIANFIKNNTEIAKEGGGSIVDGSGFPNLYLLSDEPKGDIAYNDVSFEVRGVDDLTPSANLKYSYKLTGMKINGYKTDWTAWTTSTTIFYENLPSDSYFFYARAMDENGNSTPENDCVWRLFRVNTSGTGNPVIDVAPEFVPELSIAQGESISINFAIANSGEGVLNWNISKWNDIGWLSFSPQSGDTTTEADTVTVTIDTSSLEAGDHRSVVLRIDAGVGGLKDIEFNIDVTGDQPPDIRSGDVDPPSGYTSTTFTFSVDYGDGNNDPPIIKKLIVDGNEYGMSTTDSDYTDYSKYTKELAGTQLGIGPHQFHFEFGNFGGSERLPATGEFQGPIVNSGEPTMYVYEPDGVDDYVAKNADPNYEIKWIANDPDGDTLTIALYYNTSRSESGMTLIDSNVANEGTYTWNISSVPNGSYYIYGVSDDGHGQTEDDWSSGQFTIGDDPMTLPLETWENVENISVSGQWPSIAIGPYDEVHIVWTDNGQVYYRQSQDGGYTWESTKQISTSGSDADNVEIDVDSNGNVHIVWEYNSPPQINYEKLDNDGNTLIDETNISQSSRFTEDSDITVDSNGYIHVVWGDDRNSQRDIRYRRSTNGGSSWDASVEIGNVSGDLYYPTIAADSNNVFVVITSHDTDAIYFVKSSNSGASWGSMTVMDSINNVKYPDLYYFNSQLHLVYTVPTGIYYRKSTNGGSSWTGTVLPCFPSEAVFPCVAANSTGVYATRSEGYFAESLDGGNQWSSEIDLGVGAGKWAKIDLDSSGNIHVVTGGVKYRRTGMPPECPIVQDVSPSSGQLSISSTYTVTWTATDPNPGDTVSINLFYSANNTNLADKIAIASGEANDGSYTWDVSNVPAGIYYIYVEATDGEFITGQFSNGRVIVNHEPTLNIKVLCDNVNTTERYYTIEWTGSDIDAGTDLNVSIYYDLDQDPGAKTLIAFGEDNDGKYIWDASALPKGIPYYIYLELTDGFYVVGSYSNGTITFALLPGDVNADYLVDLKDAICAMQVLAGMQSSSTINKAADVNGDGKIGIEEIVYILQVLSGARIDVTGYWKIYHATEGESGERGPDYLTFTQTGNDFSVVDTCDPTIPFASGTINGTSISLSWTEKESTVTFTGTVSDDTMEGTWTETSGISGTWRAEKTDQKYCPEYVVPTANITIDGDISDWAGIDPAITDPIGDADSTSGSDIVNIYIAKDSQHVYVRIDVGNGTPSNDLYFGISFYPHKRSQEGDRFVFVNMTSFSCSVDSWIESGGGYHDFVSQGELAVQGSIIELSVPLQDLNPPLKSFVHGWNDKNGPSIDDTDDVIAIF